MILLLGFSCCYIFIFGNENSSKLHIRILGFDKVLHCLSFFFQRTTVFSEIKKRKSEMMKPVLLVTFLSN